MHVLVVLNIIVMLGNGFCSDLGLSSKNKRSSSTLKASAFITVPQKTTAVYEESPHKRRHASHKVPGHGISEGMFSHAPSTSTPNSTTGTDSAKSPTPRTSSKGKKHISVGRRIKALSIISGVKSGESLPTSKQSPKNKKENVSFSSSQKNPKNSRILK
jgi:hypothetical protein